MKYTGFFFTSRDEINDICMHYKNLNCLFISFNSSNVYMK